MLFSLSTRLFLETEVWLAKKKKYLFYREIKPYHKYCVMFFGAAFHVRELSLKWRICDQFERSSYHETTLLFLSWL